MSDRSESEFRAQNLLDALKLVSDWELMLAEPAFSEDYVDTLQLEVDKEKIHYGTRRKYQVKFHPELVKLMADSKALMHPQLLPTAYPSSLDISSNQAYLPSENQ